MKILVVDDEVKYIRVITKVLINYDAKFIILRTTSTKEALEIVKQKEPDLIITDWEMPVMNGIEFIEKVRKHEPATRTPIIMCTGAMTSSKNLNTALSAGAFDYIRKPIDEIELIARVKTAMKIKKLYADELEKLQEEILEMQTRIINSNADTKKICEEVKKLLDDSFSLEKKEKLSEALKLMRNHNVNQNWINFEIRFNKIFPAFFKVLSEEYNHLSKNEIKICAFLKLKVSSKEIAEYLNIEVNSVRIARTRLRKKLNLQREDSLTNFINRI